MAIHVALRHTTTYKYDRPVTLSPHTVRLRPAPHARTPIHAYSLKITPAENFLNWQQDPYGNYLARLVFPKPTRTFEVSVELIAEMVPINPFDFFIDPTADHCPFEYSSTLLQELQPYLAIEPAGPKLAALVAVCRPIKPIQTNDYLVELNQALLKLVKYTIRLEPGVQSPEETLTLGSGSCRDSAWLLVNLCRHLGLAARFVSGYLIQLVADEAPLDDGPAGPVKDFTDLHAWAELYVPGAGWIGLDPTSGLLAAEGHIPLACSATPQTAAAIDGSLSFESDPNDEDDTLGEDFQFHMSVARIVETPRVTKPYRPEEWASIDKLGHQIDRELTEGDVRLTMGGEPTFVSIDHRDADEWNIAALGDHKLERAQALLLKLRDTWAPGGFLHFGQGKWYPGEQLPRWAYGCYWRPDGEPLWNDPKLYATTERSYHFTAEDAERFAVTLCRNLDVPTDSPVAGYEDAWYYMWKERRLPINLDPLKSKLDDPLERARLARVFENQLGAVVGYALPIRKNESGWESGKWFLRPENLYLLPGDSPMGFRLPLSSLPWEAEGERTLPQELDPFAAREPLPSITKQQQRKQTSQGIHKLADVDPAVVRTALCIEPRDGTLNVFFPPMGSIDDYFELVAAIETTAAELNMPVLVEGYKPPSDPRVLHFSVTPDPGVIEVNVHPAKSWEELSTRTTELYAVAKSVRLTTEKFLHDGRHTGTGGGNHMVLGGASPADSPLLRRPDVLRSLVSFWHNHPSLSYLFSGMFVGPTSQHPRVDEARHDALYEFELASAHLKNTQGTPPMWMVDRAYRHLLTDLTGNTHRTEFCIDKLYSPDSTTGRLGLLELRSFEMPPHAEMSLLQQLFLRTLVTMFWKKPYQQKLVRWGTELHDRFLLPHFVADDLHDALDEIRQAGYAFDPAWFSPHVEFRFPLIGRMTNRNVEVELRHAVEPWPVLGEEQHTGGASRYVDSSLERLQVKVRGLTDPRHVLSVNGRRVPLHPTGTNGEFVAGVRFRAWQPPSCLHPYIPSHNPLVFDLLDTWNQRSLGGCVYHVSHPGGRSSETMPVNALEAEGRRQARFQTIGHSQGALTIPVEEPNPDFPYTLDLRRVPT